MSAIKIAACQTPDIREDMNAALGWMERFAREAEAKGADLVCFPECFLQGYLTDKDRASKHALDLSSAKFAAILQRLAALNPALVFGLIEQEGNKLFNTAVVIQAGKLLTKYRKTHLLKGENIFTAGNSYPTFTIKDRKCGINICYDTQFPGAAAALAKQGVQVILCPASNMLRRQTAEKYKHLHHEMRIERAKEAKAWLISADVTGERDGRIAYGPTSAIDATGNIVAQVPLMQTGMVTVQV